MSELIPVLERLVADVDAGRTVAFCAVVERRGSAPQIPGAAMIVRADGSTCGTLGGGCVEAETRTRSLQLLQTGGSALIQFNLDSDYGWDDGLICGGEMAVAAMTVSRESNLAPFRAALAGARARQPASVPIAVEHEGRRIEYRLNLEVSPTLIIAGAGHVGQSLARFATDLDFHVVVIDDRPDFAAPARFPAGVECIVGDIGPTLAQHPIDAGCYVVIVTRGHRHDQQALEAVIRRGAAYVGMIGSRRKSSLLLRDLAERGVAKELLDAVHTPIGLPIHALTVPEIAISILAELIDIRRQRTPVLVEGPLAAAPNEHGG